MEMSDVRTMGIADARANLTDLVAEVRLLGEPVILARRDKPQAALVPLAMLERILGGLPDRAADKPAASA